MNPRLQQRVFLVLLAAAVTVLTIDITLQTVIKNAMPAAAVVSAEQIDEMARVVPTTSTELSQYIEIIDSCGPYFEGTCVRVRSGPGEEYPVVTRLRTGVILKTAEPVEHGGRTWYRVVFDEPIRYPERVGGEWYVAGEYVRPFTDEGVIDSLGETSALSTKRILVDRSEQMLYAYEGDTLFMQVHISSGLDLTPTPRGTFTVYKKTPTRYMQGPLPGISDQYYDLPGVPWNLYFTYQGGTIHGAYWHNSFGEQWSHGCVNLPLEEARVLYLWTDIGTSVTVRD